MHFEEAREGITQVMGVLVPLVKEQDREVLADVAGKLAENEFNLVGLGQFKSGKDHIYQCTVGRSPFAFGYPSPYLYCDHFGVWDPEEGRGPVFSVGRFWTLSPRRFVFKGKGQTEVQAVLRNLGKKRDTLEFFNGQPKSLMGKGQKQ